MKCLSLDFGGTSVKIGLVDEQANLEYKGKVAAPLNSVEQFVNTVSGLYEKYYIGIDGIAISMPGYIDPCNGVLVGSGAYRNLYGENIFSLVQEKCPVPLAIENDGKCAALAESWSGSLKGCESGAALVLGTALAGGMVKNGKIHSGKDFSAGELSFIITDPSEHGPLAYSYMSAGMLGMTYKICKRKNYDLSVQDCSPTLLWVDQHVQMPYAHPDNPLQPTRVDGIQLFQWLDDGDPDVIEIYRKFINSLAVVIQDVQVCFAPEKIVIGGGLSKQTRIFEDLDRELTCYYSGAELDRQLHANIVKSRYLDECNLIGAACNFFQRKTDLAPYRKSASCK